MDPREELQALRRMAELEAKASGKPQAAPEAIDPSEGMTGGEKLLVGVGSSMDKAYRGIKGLFGGDTSQGDADAALYQKHRPKGWETTAGEIIGDVASYAPAALIPGGLPAQLAAGAATSAALTPGDMETRAKAAGWGGAGAAGGHVLAKTLGRIAKPIGDKTADVLALEARGVEPTFGQSMAAKGGGIGRSVGRVEEGAMSVPLASGPLREARKRAMGQWQRATRAEALPPGAQAGAAESVDTAREAFTRAYTGTLDSVPLPYQSVQYRPDMRALSQGMPITKGQRKMVEKTFNDIRLKHNQNPAPGVQATAAGAHGAESELKALARRYGSSQDPAQQELGRLFGNVADEYGQVWRNALPPATRNEIAAIDRAYPGFAATREAAKKVGTAASGGDPSAYTPSVLLRAGRQVDRTPNKTRYLAGEAPLQDLAGQGQRVLGDTMPDSGTTERALGAGAVLGGLFLDPMSTIGGGSALAAYGTRPVQNYLTGRAAPAEQEAILRWFREMAPYMAAGGASQSN